MLRQRKRKWRQRNCLRASQDQRCHRRLQLMLDSMMLHRHSNSNCS
jgi:hypothetical protein